MNTRIVVDGGLVVMGRLATISLQNARVGVGILSSIRKMEREDSALIDKATCPCKSNFFDGHKGNMNGLCVERVPAWLL